MQARHTPTPHPYFGPVTPRRSRRTHSRGMSAGAVTVVDAAVERERVAWARSSPQPAIGNRVMVRPVARAQALATAAVAAGRPSSPAPPGVVAVRHVVHLDPSEACRASGRSGSRRSCPRGPRPVVDVDPGLQRHREPVDQRALHLRLEPAQVDRGADVDRADALRDPRVRRVTGVDLDEVGDHALVLLPERDALRGAGGHRPAPPRRRWRPRRARPGPGRCSSRWRRNCTGSWPSVRATWSTITSFATPTWPE